MTDIEASVQQQQQQLQNVQRMHQESCLQELQQQLSAQFAAGRFVTTQQQEQPHQGPTETTAVPSSLVPFLPFMHPSLALMPGQMSHQPAYSHSHNHHVHKLGMQPMWPNPAVAAAHIQAALAAAAVAAASSNNNSNSTPNPATANKTNKREEELQNCVAGSAGIADTVSILECPQNVAKYQSHSHSTPPDSPQGRCQSTEDGFISMKSSSPEELNQSDAQISEMDAPLNLSKPKGSPRSSPSSTYVKDREHLTPIVPSPPLSWQTAGTSVSAPGLPHPHPSTALFADVEANYLQSRVSQWH